MPTILEKRLELHDKLTDLLGSKNVYYQPPASVQMKYPAIRYERSNFNNLYANNDVYTQSVVYEVTVIDEDPDSKIIERMSKLTNCKYERSYTGDGLNHDVYTIIY